VDQGEHRTPVPVEPPRKAEAKALRTERVEHRTGSEEERHSFAEVEAHQTGSEALRTTEEVHRNPQVHLVGAAGSRCCCTWRV
jgi:hypothetical protein